MDAHTTQRRSTRSRGFSLIELLVVMGILVVISAITLANNAQFGGVVTLRNLAYDIALSVREAQVYGIAVRKYDSSSFQPGYGVHFRTSSPTSYLLFVDGETEDGLYGGAGELLESFAIGRGHEISDLCATPAGGSEVCSLTKLDVVFPRPEPDAQVRYNDGTTLQQRARIIVESPRGDTASVIIEATGQISVQ